MYVVATPLGNLNDMSLRALALLKAVDAVAAEDTRHSQKLLDAFGITTRLVALHEHNEQAAAGQVIRMLEEGRHVALITDAGTPGHPTAAQCAQSFARCVRACGTRGCRTGQKCCEPGGESCRICVPRAAQCP